MFPVLWRNPVLFLVSVAYATRLPHWFHKLCFDAIVRPFVPNLLGLEDDDAAVKFFLA